MLNRYVLIKDERGKKKKRGERKREGWRKERRGKQRVKESYTTNGSMSS